ncbi:hypothetical protein AV530_000573 [Patagioenas fasciata monilis]|uniref:Uncharacterized protein n=1 Tax=Patagioenas fasciata monilis TaxID=372326 RepID=A0A1V4IGZ9_PATFA|nr:hypothetical protein AV530_000573 [Patagioenas fasciata monilis]
MLLKGVCGGIQLLCCQFSLKKRVLQCKSSEQELDILWYKDSRTTKRRILSVQLHTTEHRKRVLATTTLSCQCTLTRRTLCVPEVGLAEIH